MTEIDITELFDRDPLSLSDNDITNIIIDMRKRRAQFNLGNMSAGNTKKKPVSKEKAAVLDLGEQLQIKL